jgi:hypothetical protein
MLRAWAPVSYAHAHVLSTVYTYTPVICDGCLVVFHVKKKYIVYILRIAK